MNEGQKKATLVANRGQGPRVLSRDPESPTATNRLWLSRTVLLMSMSRTEVATYLVQSDPDRKTETPSKDCRYRIHASARESKDL